MNTRARSLFVPLIASLMAFVVLVATPSYGFAEEGGEAKNGQDLISMLEHVPSTATGAEGAVGDLSAPPISTQAVSFDYVWHPTAANDYLKKAKKNSPVAIRLGGDLINQTIKIPSGADVTIDLNGHDINRGKTKAGRNDAAIIVGSNARVLIKDSTAPKKRTFGIYRSDGSRGTTTYTSAGIIMNGYNSNGGGGIEISGGVKLTLDNVTIAGNRAEQNVGTSGYGGGIYAGGKDVAIVLKNSRIIGNYAYNDGGGICANNTLSVITLTNSVMDGNAAKRHGGAIELDSDNSIISGDGKSSLRYNYAGANGGAVYLNKGGSTVKGLTIENNKASGTGGGGAWSDSSSNGFASLVIKGNSAPRGGGLYITSSKNSIASCTITDNTTYNTAWNMGGGVYAKSGITSGFSLSGTSVIKDNKGGNFILAEGDRVNVALARSSNVHMDYEVLKTTSVQVSSDGERLSNCIRYLSSDANNHFTYNASTKTMWYVAGSKDKNNTVITGQPAKDRQSLTKINPSDAAPKATGKKYNGYEVLRGIVRFPSVEDGRSDSATSFYYSDGYFTDDPYQYNEHLATLSMCMAMSGFYLNAGGTTDYTNKHASARQFMSDIGCDDDKIYVNDWNVQKPGTATIGVTISSKTIKDADGAEVVLVPIAVRGAGYEAEWSSNVTLGGTVGAEAAGFADAANKVFTEVNAYIAKYGLKDRAKQGRVKFWIAGYSRAGATSNLVAKRLIDRYVIQQTGHKCDVYAYPMEAPQGGTDNSEDKRYVDKYNCIHNIINQADLVPLVGPTKMGFKRYGVDHFIPGTAAGGVKRQVRQANRAGDNRATYNWVYWGHDTARMGRFKVTTRSDNEVYATNSASYPTMRNEMLLQLVAVDPSMDFDDFFQLGRMRFVTPKMWYESANQEVIEERFIVDFINDLQRWGIGNRKSYADKLEGAFQDVIGTVFALDNEAMDGFVTRASTVLGRVDYLFSSDLTMHDIYDYVIHHYEQLSEERKMKYVKAMVGKIEESGAFDYLTPAQAAKFKKSLPAFVDFAFKLLRADYVTPSYDDNELRMLSTFVLNSSRIMSNHYPEVNLAWLRAADSYYKDDKTSFALNNAKSVDAPSAYVGKTKLVAGSNANAVATGDQDVTLNVDNVKGEAVYYKVTKGGTTTSANTCKNGYDIYRGAVRVSLNKGETCTITAYAMSFGTKSQEVTYTLKAQANKHKVTIVGEPDETNSKPGVSKDYEEGATVELKAQESVTAEDAVYKFHRWIVTNERGNNCRDLVEDIGVASTKMTLPESGPRKYRSGYSLTARALYKRYARNDNLHKVTVSMGSGSEAHIGFVRDGRQFKYKPTIPEGKTFVSWKVEASNGGTDWKDITNALKPTTDGTWAGKSKAEVLFAAPKVGETVKAADNSEFTFAKGYELRVSTELVDIVTKIDVAGVESPFQRVTDPQANTYTAEGTNDNPAATVQCYKQDDAQGNPTANVPLQKIVWEKTTATNRNEDTTYTHTRTWHASIRVDVGEGTRFANGDALAVTMNGNPSPFEDKIKLDGGDDIANKQTWSVARVTRRSDSSVFIDLQIKQVVIEGKATFHHTVTVQVANANRPVYKEDSTTEIDHYEPLKDKNGDPITWDVDVTVREDKPTFEIFRTRDVSGGKCDDFFVPANSGLEKVNPHKPNHIDSECRIVDSTKDLVLQALYMPNFSSVIVRKFPQPTKDQELPTKDALNAELLSGQPSDQIDLEYVLPDDSPFLLEANGGLANYYPYIDDITWTPAPQAEGKAAGDTQYRAEVKLGYRVKKSEGVFEPLRFIFEYNFDTAAVIETPQDAPAYESAKFLQHYTILSLAFKRTERSKDHTVTVVDNADGTATTNTWKEGDAKSVIAKDDYSDRVFTGWVVKCGDAEVPDEELVKLGLDASKLTRRTLAFTMPAVVEGSEPFTNAYSLSLTATYKPKAESLMVTLAQPTEDAVNLSDVATVKWQWGEDEQTQSASKEVAVSWGEDVRYSETMSAHKYTATMRLDPATARELKRGNNLPSIVNGWASESSATWNADGSLTIALSFTAAYPLPAYQVVIGAYDVNDYDATGTQAKLKQRKAGEDGIETLVDVADTSQTIVRGTDARDGFKLVAPTFAGAEFVGWAIPEGSKVTFVDQATKDSFEFVGDATTQDPCMVHALYKPIVTKLQVSVPAPVAGQSLATNTTEGVSAEVAELQNADMFTNRIPSVSVSELLWSPEAGQDVAAYDTGYAASAKLQFAKDGGAWQCGFASDVAVNAGDSETLGWFEGESGTAHLYFPATERDKKHSVTIRDFHEEDGGEQVRKENWSEGEYRYLIAKEYEDKTFTGWTISVDDKEIESTDATKLAKLGLTNNAEAPYNRLTDQEIVLTMPEGDVNTENADFPREYSLSAVANYKDKVSALMVALPQPPIGPDANSSTNDTATLEWDDNGTHNEVQVPIQWMSEYSQSESDGEKVCTTNYTAILDLHTDDEETNSKIAAMVANCVEFPEVIASLQAGSEDGLQIDAAGAYAEKGDGNALLVSVPFVSEIRTVQSRKVVFEACDANSEGHGRLKDTPAQTLTYYADEYEDDTDEFTLHAPVVAGGLFVGWEYDEDNLVKVLSPNAAPASEADETTATFKFRDSALTGATYTIKALYMPIVENVVINFDAPVGGKPLAGKDDARVRYDLQNGAFEELNVAVAQLTWKMGSTTASAVTPAEFNKEYTATVTCDPGEALFAYADDVMAFHGAQPIDFTTANHAAVINFDATEKRPNHEVNVVDNAAGSVASYRWQEQSVKHLVAKSNDDREFVDWTVKRIQGTDEQDVTETVLGNLKGNATIALTVPQSSGNAGATFQKNYSLSVVANYRDKVGTLNVSLAKPGTEGGLAQTATLAWVQGAQSQTAPCDVMWTQETSTEGTLVNQTCTATLRLAPADASKFKRNGLNVTVNDDANQPVTAKWSDDGSLTITTSFKNVEAAVSGVSFRNVTVEAYDVNTGAKLPNALFSQRLYSVPVRTSTVSGTDYDQFVLMPHNVPGGAFVEWQGDGGSVDGNTITVPATATNVTVKAFYKPVVSSVNVRLAAPDPDAATPLAANAALGATLANVSLFSSPGAGSGTVAWTPEGDYNADKEYEAAVGIAYTKAPLSDGWQFAYAPSAYATASADAYVSLDTATTDTTTGTAYVSFDESAPTQLLAVYPPEDVFLENSQNNATAIATYLAQNRTTTQIEVSGDDVAEAPVEWETPVCVENGGKTLGSTWYARGKVKLSELYPTVQAPDTYTYVAIYVDASDTLNLVEVMPIYDVYGLQAGADEATVRGQLPESVMLSLEEGESAEGTITWNTVRCVDEVGTIRYSAKWTATGTITLPEGVTNTDGVSLDVSIDVYVDLPDVADNLAEAPRATPDEDHYNSEKPITLYTNEEGGTVYYRIVPDEEDIETTTIAFQQFTGEPIYLDNESAPNGMLCIQAYTVPAAGSDKQNSDVTTFVYELDNNVAVPEGEDHVFNGFEQVGVWAFNDYDLVSPSSGANVDESGNAVATNVGTYTVVARLNKQGDYRWVSEWPEDPDEYEAWMNAEADTADKTVTFTITPNTVNNCTFELAKSVAYTGKAVEPKPVVRLGDYVAVEGRDYTLTYKDNVTVGKATVTITGKGNLKDTKTIEFEVDGGAQLTTTYAGHVQTYGDITSVRNGASLGTVGQSKRIESFSATVTGGTIEYRSHVQRKGWETAWAKDGMKTGTTGMSRRLEAMQMRLSDRLTEAGYHVWYRVHAQTYGWLGWACDGAPAGTSGQSKRLEAIQVVVLKGDAKPKGYDARRTAFNGRVTANAHVQTFGWLGYKSAGRFGTTGKSKRMEAFWLRPGGLPPATGVEYLSHVQRQGWEKKWSSNGKVSGTLGKSRRVEALRIRLTGDSAKHLSVWYRVHSQTFGWSGWAKDGAPAGTSGYSKRVESVEVVVLSKGATPPGTTKNALRAKR